MMHKNSSHRANLNITMQNSVPLTNFTKRKDSDFNQPANKKVDKQPTIKNESIRRLSKLIETKELNLEQ